jgi:CRISPR-associated protein Cmr5
MLKETNITKLEKGRAEFAYKCAVEAKDKKEDEYYKKSEYRSRVKKIPTMILSNGLGQTLAFIKSKSKEGNAYELIYKQITDYMKSEHPSRINMPNGEDDLTKWVINVDSSTYRYITQEILAFLNWLRRFAEGLIKEKEDANE